MTGLQTTARIAFGCVTLVLAACQDPGTAPTPTVPEGKLPADQPYDDLPVLLTGKGLGGMEAITAGALRREGLCLLLDTGSEQALIVWGDGTRIIEDDVKGWAVQFSSGLQASEGDRIVGGGGGLPPAAPIANFVQGEVPEECADRPAVQVHSVESVTRVAIEPMGSPDTRAPPPPPPPPAPSFLDSVKNSPEGSGAEPAEVLGIDDPREALFAHMIGGLREGEGFHNRPACLREVDGAILARLSDRFTDVFAAPMCRWDGGGVVLRDDDSPAVFVDARLECDGRSRCVAEGARVFANMGGEGQGYIMRPIPGGWSIETAGVSWIS
ncbi:hypothetical protein P8Q88_04255 [Qipengyuania sp. XHP0207]|uniref:hypothetical protein n=1 Tax=Qipengyuania sp. XHP0207 TaxID=3038078 RepID=UPI00241D5DEC|nr:hypothetical protein [Qipengyuania sp. XHP0207]MDG5747383.1 hypothetical protein [Qipengyuania sp. XHP0207]